MASSTPAKYLILLSCFLLLLTACTSPKQDEAKATLATCLIEKGVHEYGAFWCPHCAEQAQLFGTADALLKSGGVYVECDVRCDVSREELPTACRGIIGQSGLCAEKKIEGYPTWDLPNSTRLTGPQPLDVLAEKAGCPYTPSA